MKAHPQVKALVLGMAAALGIGGLTYTPDTRAQFVVTDPGHTIQTIMSEVARAVDAASDYAQQLQQVQNQYMQLTNDARNLANLPNNIFQQYASIYQAYNQQLQQLQGLMSDLNNVRASYQQQYPDLAASNPTFQQMSQLSRQWEQAGRQNIEDALANGAAVLSTMQQTQQGFQSLGNDSQAATGALQAMQAGNQINMLVGQELMKLNAQTVAFQQAQLQQQARELASDQASNQKLRAAYGNGNAFNKSSEAPAPRLGDY